MSTHPPTNPATEPAPSNGRGPGGRFAKGNPGGPGNPFARRVAALRSALIQSVQAEDLIAIARTLIEKARQGDTAAAKLVYQYVLGKPAETVDPDRLDADEWQGFKETATMMKELPQVGTAPAAELPLRQVRITRPILAETMRQQLVEGFQRSATEARAASQTVPNEDKVPSTNRDIGNLGEPWPPLDPAAWAELLDLAPPSINGQNPPRRPPDGDSQPSVHDGTV